MCLFSLTWAAKSWQRSEMRVSQEEGVNLERNVFLAVHFSLWHEEYQHSLFTFCQPPYAVLYNQGKLPFFLTYSACVNI